MKHGEKWGIGLLIFFVTVIVIIFSATSKPTVQEGGENTPTTQAEPFQSSKDKPVTFTGTVFANDESPQQYPWFTEIAASVLPLYAKQKVLPKRPAVERDTVTINNKVYPLRTYQTLQTPNDPFSSQWWVSQSSADVAWDVTPGSYQTVLAVIDSGFALSHEEFASRWAINVAETGTTSTEGPSQLNCSAKGLALNYSCNLVDDDVDGIVDNESGVAPYENPSQLNCSAQAIVVDKSCNRIDDDRNGYTDDTLGWDIINQDRSVQTGQLSPAGSATSHGTMVAGIAAATGNNNVGIAGVNWQTKILPIQALDDDGYGNTKSVGDAIYYAVSRNVDVINISLGSEYNDEYVREAIEAATAAGIVVVASSGNDGCECMLYPARYPEVVAVGALDASGNKASFSSWGSSLDIAAPGAGLTLPSWSSSNQSSRYSSGVAGTSFSSPFIAGSAALAKSHQPSAKPLHIIAALRESASRTGYGQYQVHDAYYGYGKTNLSALRSRMTTPKDFSYVYAFSPISSGGYFSGHSYETAGPYAVQDCGLTQASMPIYELKNATNSFFSVSEVEARRATLGGYGASVFAHACMRQPHDTVGSVRVIDLFREFRNVYKKL